MDDIIKVIWILSGLIIILILRMMKLERKIRKFENNISHINNMIDETIEETKTKTESKMSEIEFVDSLSEDIVDNIISLSGANLEICLDNKKLITKCLYQNIKDGKLINLPLALMAIDQLLDMLNDLRNDLKCDKRLVSGFVKPPTVDSLDEEIEYYKNIKQDLHTYQILSNSKDTVKQYYPNYAFIFKDSMTTTNIEDDNKE